MFTTTRGKITQTIFKIPPYDGPPRPRHIIYYIITFIGTVHKARLIIIIITTRKAFDE